jgi:hypothetical protein
MQYLVGCATPILPSKRYRGSLDAITQKRDRQVIGAAAIFLVPMCMRDVAGDDMFQGIGFMTQVRDTIMPEQAKPLRRGTAPELLIKRPLPHLGSNSAWTSDAAAATVVRESRAIRQGSVPWKDFLT